MKDSLVAINIIVNDKIINKNGVPILFYWDGENSLIKDIYNDVSFKSLLYNSIINYDNYANAKLSFFYFTFENGEEKYTEDFSIIQNELTLKDLEAEKSIFYKEYLLYHFLFLYKSAYHEDYGEDISIMGIDDAVLDIYDKIQEKYPKRVIKSTVINYIRGELQKTDNLSMENTDWIIAQLETLLTERD